MGQVRSRNETFYFMELSSIDLYPFDGLNHEVNPEVTKKTLNSGFWVFLIARCIHFPLPKMLMHLRHVYFCHQYVQKWMVYKCIDKPDWVFGFDEFFQA